MQLERDRLQATSINLNRGLTGCLFSSERLEREENKRTSEITVKEITDIVTGTVNAV